MKPNHKIYTVTVAALLCALLLAGPVLALSATLQTRDLDFRNTYSILRLKNLTVSNITLSSSPDPCPTGQNYFMGRFWGNQSDCYQLNRTAAGIGNVYQSNGYTGIATNTPGVTLDVNGTIQNGGNITSFGTKILAGSATLEVSVLNGTSNGYIAGSQICTAANGVCTGGGGAIGNGSWILLAQYTLSSNTTAIVWPANTSFEFYQVCVALAKGNTAANDSIALRLNSVSSGYRYNTLAYSTLTNPSSVGAFNLTASGTGTQSVEGCGMINRQQISILNDNFLSGTFTSSDQVVMWGGRLTNMAGTNVSNITIGGINAGGTNLTGRIRISGMT